MKLTVDIGLVGKSLGYEADEEANDLATAVAVKVVGLKCTKKSLGSIALMGRPAHH